MDLSIGFEFEFLSPLPMAETRKNLFEKYSIETYNAMPEMVMGYDRWWMVPDGSIRRLAFDGYSMELVSPAFWSVEEGLASMNRIFGIMNLESCVTNESCGFHVGIGHPNIKAIDPLKLILFLQEAKWLNEFQRSRNTYCKPIMKAIHTKLRYNARHGIAGAETLNGLRNMIPWNKYHSVNFTKMRDGYIEFRIIGGENYHCKIGMVNKAVAHFLDCVKAALTPEYDKERYAQLIENLRSSQGWAANTPVPRRKRRPELYYPAY